CTPSRAPFAPPERTFVWSVRTGVEGVNVTCDTDTTTSDLTIGLPAPAIGVPVNGLISPGVTVDGLGLSFESTLGNPLRVSKAGPVTTGEAVNALSLSGSGGDVLYTGNGSVTNTNGGELISSALRIINTGNVIATIGGNISTTGGFGIAISSGGDVLYTGNGSVIKTG